MACDVDCTAERGEYDHHTEALDAPPDGPSSRFSTIDE